MLKKIDCVMLKVADIHKASQYYQDVFGLHFIWQDELSVGLGFLETDAEIVLHNQDTPPDHLSVHYLVDDVLKAVAELETQGCTVIEAPFDIVIGKCAVIEDPFGIQLAILDMTKGAR